MLRPHSTPPPPPPSILQYYVSQILIVASLLCSLYYVAFLALLGLDRQILAGKRIFLLGDINFAQWFAQSNQAE